MSTLCVVAQGEYINFFPFSYSRCVCVNVCVRGNVVKNSKNLAQANGARAKGERVVEIMTNNNTYVLYILWVLLSY